jgi:YHS domain-containing protein
MSKTNAIYIIVGITAVVAIFLGVAATNSTGSNPHSQAIQQNAECCPEDASHTTAKEKAWNEACPVMGGKVQATSATVEFNEKHYGFCCPGCIDQFAENPEKFAANLSEDGKDFIKN